MVYYKSLSSKKPEILLSLCYTQLCWRSYDNDSQGQEMKPVIDNSTNHLMPRASWLVQGKSQD